MNCRNSDFYKEKSRQYVEDGFCVIENVLDDAYLKTIQKLCSDYLSSVSDKHRNNQISTGSLIDVSKMPELVNLITYPKALQAYEEMGFDDVRFSTGYLISKPPQSPPLFWHFDWMGWDHPRSYEKGPLQTFFMYYLVDTNVENGCLKVIPKSHIEEHPLHDLMRSAHTEDLRQAKDLNANEFLPHPDEVNVCVKAGDLVIGDSRIIHGSHPNNSNVERPVITLWMHPNYSQMPEELQAFTANINYNSWSPQTQKTLESFKPSYHGTVESIKRSRNREKRSDYLNKK
jgi:ectoine hydroxylase-related dioxygenase (phytanoyl-CoA dioxygenase family)